MEQNNWKATETATRNIAATVQKAELSHDDKVRVFDVYYSLVMALADVVDSEETGTIQEQALAMHHARQALKLLDINWGDPKPIEPGTIFPMS